MTPLGHWAYGYAAARRYPRPEPEGDGHCLWFAVGKPDQAGRLVLLDANPDALAATLASEARPHVYVEAALPRVDALAAMSPGWQVRDPAWLMRLSRATTEPVHAMPAGSDIRIDRTARAITITLTIADALAANGTVEFDGRTAGYDRIETGPGFHRRGLGAWIMNRLTALSVEAGATSHLLIATPDGRALYAHRGWQELSDVVSLISPDFAA